MVVGDRVEYETADDGTAAIVGVCPRSNYIIRRSPNLSKESHIIAANVDQAFLVVSLYRPATNNEFIDRFLVTAEAYRVPATLVLNKCDLYVTDELRETRAAFLHAYSLAGYEVLETSAERGDGVEALKARLTGKVSLLSGNSGVASRR